MKTPHKNGLHTLLALGLCAAGTTHADTITVLGQRLENVIVRESPALYYVQDTATGTVSSVPKSEAKELTRSTDPAETARLQAAWKSAHAALPGTRKEIEARDVSAPAASAEAESDPGVPRLVLRGSDGRIPYIRLKNVPLRDALDATLRPLNLDYKVENGFLFISSPEIIAHETFEPLETRVYHDIVDDTLPKIVLRNPASVVGNAGTTGFGGSGGTSNLFANGGGSFGGGASGGGAFGGAGSFGSGGGFGTGVTGFGGGGGFGNAGGGGGYGGGANGGGYAGDVTTISNISDLFTNIDDRLVGEAPAQIAVGFQVARPR